MRENFSKMEQKIADYILNHPEEVKQFLWKQAEDLERVIEMIWG